MNCKFKFHLRAALHRGAAGPAGSAEMVGPADGPGGLLFPDFQVCGSRSKTEFIGFAGRCARTVPAGGLLFPDFKVCGSRSKTKFFGFAGRRARTAPARRLPFSGFQIYGSRSKTEFIGFAGRCARTVPAGGLLFPDFKVCGSRSKTKFFGFAGRRARTEPACPHSDEKRCTEGSVSASVHLFPLLFFQKERIDDRPSVSSGLSSI